MTDSNTVEIEDGRQQMLTHIKKMAAKTIIISDSKMQRVTSRGQSESATLVMCEYIHTHSECCRFPSAARRHPVARRVPIL